MWAYADCLQECAENSHPIIHGNLVALIQEYIELKKEHGTLVEWPLYAKETPASFVSRVLLTRPLAFLNSSDSYLLRNGQQGNGGFDEIGTEAEKPPLVLKDTPSYSDIQIAAMISLAGPSILINDGNRKSKCDMK